MGWWPVNFPGFDDPPYGDDWHIEGGWFHHHVSSPEQALLNLFCFSTVDPGGGGTLVRGGLAPLGCSHPLGDGAGGAGGPTSFDEPLNTILDQRGWPGTVEVAGEEGDVVLGHPLLLHSSNPNHGTRPRIMAQPAFSMTEPMRTVGDDLCPVEIPLALARPRTPRLLP